MQFWKCGYLTWPCCCRIWPGSPGCGKSVYILIHTPSCYVYRVGNERYRWMHGISLLAWSLDTRLSRSGARGEGGGGGGGGRGREKLLKRYDVINICPLKNGLCPSKNSFDRIIWQAPAAKLFQALSGMCWCYFQTRGSTLDLRSEQKGLLWILDEESIFPGANDSSFLARLYVHHCNDSEYKYIIQVMYADYGKCRINVTFLQPELLIFSLSFACRCCFKKLRFPSPLANASPRLRTKQRK